MQKPFQNVERDVKANPPDARASELGYEASRCMGSGQQRHGSVTVGRTPSVIGAALKSLRCEVATATKHETLDGFDEKRTSSEH